MADLVCKPVFVACKVADESSKIGTFYESSSVVPNEVEPVLSECLGSSLDGASDVTNVVIGRSYIGDVVSSSYMDKSPVVSCSKSEEGRPDISSWESPVFVLA